MTSYDKLVNILQMEQSEVWSLELEKAQLQSAVLSTCLESLICIHVFADCRNSTLAHVCEICLFQERMHGHFTAGLHQWPECAGCQEDQQGQLEVFLFGMVVPIKASNEKRKKRACPSSKRVITAQTSKNWYQLVPGKVGTHFRQGFLTKKPHASLLPVGTARLWGGSLEKLSKEETCSTINLEKETVALPTFFWSAVVPEEYANMELVEWKLEGMVAIPYLKPEQQPADLLQACWWGRWP